MNTVARQNTGSGFESFYGLLDKYASYVEAAGRKFFRSSPGEAIEIFNSLTPDRQERLLERLRIDVSILSEMVEAKENLNSTKRLLWRFMKECKFSFCSDVFDTIQVGDVVEIYSADQIHLWQNMDFFDWVSVSLERIYCDTWCAGSKRDPEIEKKLFETFVQVLSGKIDRTIHPDVPWHLMEERETELLLRFDIRIKAVSPVFRDRQIVGLITINECRGVD